MVVLNSFIQIFYLVILIVTMKRSIADAAEFHPPASEFTRHSVVQPVLLHGRTKREISTTKSEGGQHHLDVILKVPINDEEYLLDLRLNQDMVTENHVLSYQENGKTVVYKPKKEDMDLCHYMGSVREKPGSWAAVSTCRGIQGLVFDGERLKYIEPVQGGDLNAEHYLYDHADLTESHPQKYDYGQSNSTLHKQKSLRNRFKRYAPSDHLVRGPFKANERSLYVELALVVDRGVFQIHKFDLSSVYREMKIIANHMNAVFSPLNIFIALVDVEVWKHYDEILLNSDSETVLDGFLEYRRTVMVKKNVLNDFAFLITDQKFEGTVIGKAYVEKICSHKSSGGVANYHTSVTGLLAMTVAHELGHSFGMNHDEESNCECKEEKCIMSFSSTSIIPTTWSPCSLSSLALSFSKGLDYCLRNKPTRLLDSPTCGNGFVEPGEQCDCGEPAVGGAHNLCTACCEPRTCLLRANATCSTGMCCDLKTCRPKSVGTECRSAKSECDLPEFCTGQSEYCPDDVYKMDTTLCGTDEETAYCVKGGCRSHSDQCRVLWGPTGKSCSDNIYDNNIKAGYSDCGYDLVSGTYEQCAESDVMCGRLLCTHLSESSKDFGDLQIGSENIVRFLTIASPVTERIFVCSAASIDLGLSVVDFGMVPDGAKCGDGMMCLQQKCVSVAAIREKIARVDSSVCPSNCSGHGICNSLGHCHCERGFAPPLCAEPGAGGSKDSGPASDERITERIFVCSAASIDLGLSVVDFGMVPDGAKCGDGMICLQQKCVPVAAIRERIAHVDSSVCPSNCSGHGVCNSLGHCHCEPGFSPPLCAEPGAGGSKDSGPASDESIFKRFMVALYVIFLGIVPAIALIFLIVYCYQNKCFEWKYKCNMSFKSRENKDLKNNVNKDDSPIYANTEIIFSSCTKGANADTNASSLEIGPIYANIEEISNRESPRYNTNFKDGQKKIPPAKPLKPTNKSNYNIVTTGIELIKPRPLVKPGHSSDNSPTKNRPIAVHRMGLNSTTNTMVAKIYHNSSNVGNSILPTGIGKQNFDSSGSKK